MLVSLHIENVATIKSVDIEFDYGFTVLSGETGAGKSVIIDSVELLLGEKSNRELIRSGESSAYVRAIFTGLSERKIKTVTENGIECDGELEVQRQIYDNGRNIIKCNGRTVPTYVLKNVMKELIAIHGQNASQSLLEEDSYIRYLDAYAEDAGALDAYAESFDKLNSAVNEQRLLIMDEREKARTTEELDRQIKEIESAALKDGEEDELLAGRARIKNIEQTAKYVRAVYRNLYHSEKAPAAVERIDAAIDALSALNETEKSDGISEQITRLNSFRYEIEDIAQTTKELLSGIEEDPTEALDRIETRLSLITHLKRKYGSDIAEIKKYYGQLKQKKEDMRMADQRIAELSAKIKKYKAETLEKAEKLTEIRKAAARRLSEGIVSELKYLELSKVRFEVHVDKLARLTANGADSVVFMIATNSGDELKPLYKIASGGELSRIMLAMKSTFAGKDDIDTVIYDEVDTGISGATSEKIGIRLRQTAKDSQVIAVTHSAQVASSANEHILIYKTDIDGRTQTFCRPLNDDERVHELSRIMGGADITKSVVDAAAELLKKNN